MGRELGINRIDFLKDGTAVIRHSDYNLCGRTDFTGDITSLFYEPEKPVCYLLIAMDDMPDKSILNKIHEVHVTVEDDYWDEKEFDIEYAYVDRARIKEICDINAKKDDRELEREGAMLEDARIARQHTTTLEEFEKFSEFIDNLFTHYSNYYEEAKDYWNEVRKIENTLKESDDNVVDSYVLLVYSE